ncbi:uncharacterized protein JN550_009698 [Neoarthrinium moseri]|uniref:uncharacterized protein n=1 Tax=Neoarthrinium moseri TaxID=1658444 RepID=UPI001FDCE733|nr:uncharacterized protein JN550_009698 [Neoarthrinium moseri]KAI1863172.1 hypothetical protein JN550_009698 [Neoarthrinium moseri]
MIAYAVIRPMYLLFFHPASRFPGPKLAATSHAVYAYYWIRGRWPWFQEAMLEKYGDVVRVAPNELVFLNPKAATGQLFEALPSIMDHTLNRELDIYGPAMKSQEIFQKTDMMDFGSGDLGLTWENDPAKHREVARKILPAFSSKAIKAKEPILQSYIDLFISRMREIGGLAEGLEMSQWLLWLCADIAADLAYGRETHHVRDGKSSDFIDTLRATSFPGTLWQLSGKFPLVAPFAFFFVPLKILLSMPKTFKAVSEQVQARIASRGNTKHPDYMDYMVSPEGPVPTSKKDLTHIEQVALQMFIAGFDPMQVTFFASIYFLVQNLQACSRLTKEIRDTFSSYDDITPEALSSLKYLHAFIQETLRMHPVGSNGLPRISPGATVDGVYVPKGVSLFGRSATIHVQAMSPGITLSSRLSVSSALSLRLVVRDFFTNLANFDQNAGYPIITLYMIPRLRMTT